MGLKWWLKFIAQCLVKLIILVVWAVGLMRLILAHPQVAGVLCFLFMLDVYLFFRAEDEERKSRPRFFEWFPLCDGFYMWLKPRKKGETRWTI